MIRFTAFCVAGFVCLLGVAAQAADVQSAPLQLKRLRAEHALLWRQAERLQAENDTLKATVAKLKNDLAAKAAQAQAKKAPPAAPVVTITKAEAQQFALMGRLKQMAVGSLLRDRKGMTVKQFLALPGEDKQTIRGYGPLYRAYKDLAVAVAKDMLGEHIAVFDPESELSAVVLAQLNGPDGKVIGIVKARLAARDKRVVQLWVGSKWRAAPVAARRQARALLGGIWSLCGPGRTLVVKDVRSGRMIPSPERD